MVVLQVLAIALTDSLNPTSVVIQMLLLAQRQALRLSTAFIASVFVTYLGFGLLVIGGLNFFLKDEFWQQFNNRPAYLIQGVIGVLVVVVCLQSLNRGTDAKGEEEAEKARLAASDGSLWKIALLGSLATASDMPTALPYFAAIDLILKAALPLPAALLLLVAYNVVFVLPLLLLVGFFVACAHRFRAWLDRHAAAVQRGVIVVSLWLLVGVGVVLIVDAACFLRVGVPLIP